MVNLLGKVTTISILKQTKKMLEEKKGKNKTWDTFLRELIIEKERLESIVAAKKLESKFNSAIEKGICISSNDLKRSLKFKEI